MADPDPIEAAVRRAVESSATPYEALPCEPELADTRLFCEHYGVAPEDSANTIIVAGKAEEPRYVACVLLATTKLDVNGCIRRRLGVRKASFASAEQTRELTGMSIGGVTPLALPDGLPVWVDDRVMERDQIILGGGSRSLKIRVSPEVLRTVPGSEIVPGLAVPVA